MVQSPTGLIAPLLRSHIRSSFLDIVFHLTYSFALPIVGWLTPRMPRKDGQRRLMRACVWIW
jgi:hypothetical protein